MKKIVLALALCLVGGASFSALNIVAHRTEQRLRASQSEWGSRTQRLAALEVEKATLSSKIRALQRDLQRHGEMEVPEFAGLLEANKLASLTPEALERMRAELGVSWHSSAEWILLSKTTLAIVRMDALKGSKLADPACGTLAITVDERRSLDDAFVGVREEFAAWSQANLQRAGTNCETVVRFTIPPNLELAAGLSNRLASTVLATLGEQRAELLQHYADEWYKMEIGGLVAMTNTLTVSHRANGDETPRLYYEFSLKGGPGQGSRGESARLTTRSHFPSSFKGVFPGGWREVAEREGFDLPNEFPNGAKQR